MSNYASATLISIGHNIRWHLHFRIFAWELSLANFPWDTSLELELELELGKL